jgi:plasmid rolling circle replication initiator protein Rep
MNLLISDLIGEVLLSEKIESDCQLNILKNSSIDTSNLLRVGAKYFNNDKLLKWSKSIAHCGSWLSYAETLDGLKLRSANFCRCRICPMCSARQSKMWRGRSFQVLQNTKIFDDYDLLFLTLTLKNCLLTDLKSTVRYMAKSFQKFVGMNRYNLLKGNKIHGFIRSLETTMPNDPYYAHPHYHVMIAVDQSYWLNYLDHNDWREAWGKSLNSDYLPSVYINKVKDDLSFLEILKYELKPDDYKNNWQWLSEFALQIYGSRKLTLGGEFKKEFSFLEYQPDLIFENAYLNKVKSSNKRINFTFDHNLRQYIEYSG